MKVFLDFETKSEVNLPIYGAYNYAPHISTEILLLAYAIDSGPIKVLEGCEELPDEFIDAIENGEGVYAFNAQFERLIWRHCMPDEISEPKWHCIQAQVSAAGLPRNLDAAGYVTRHVGTAKRKLEGQDLIKLFSVPPFADPKEYPKEWALFKRYCARDVHVARELHRVVMELPEREEEEYKASEAINDAGIEIDTTLAKAVVKHKKYFTDKAKEAIIGLSEGQVYALSGAGLANWLISRIPERCKPVVESASTKSGYSFGADNLTKLHSMLDPEEDITLFRVVDTLINDNPGNATAKFNRMLSRADDSGVLRGAFIFNGAATGRFSSQGVQLQNMPRETFDENNAELLYAVKSGDSNLLNEACREFFLSPIKVMKGLVRYSLLARKRHIYIGADWSQIEGRFAPWLAETGNWEDKLEAYSNPKRDVYTETAEAILGRPIVDSIERNSYGKVTELSLGYGGAKNALLAMANSYRVKINRPDEVVERWRENNPWATLWHKNIRRGIYAAIDNPNKLYKVGKVIYRYAPQYLGGALLCKLPSGRLLTYPFCSKVVLPNEKHESIVAINSSIRPKSGEKGWPARRLWHGLVCENITQAAAADLLRGLLVNLSRQNVKVIAHSHDEILVEVLNESKAIASTTKKIQKAMLNPPEWAKGLPLALEYWTGYRYRK